MRKSRAFIFVLVVLLPFMAGCASSGMKKPTVFVDKPNSIPADIPSQFLNRYEHFVTGKERKEFKKLLTDEERQVFIDKFWAARDPDPTTPENEYKQEIDERIDDIADERFFGTPGTTGLLFRSNGGFRGDMARVYLLHGEPDALDILEGHSFVPLMLWIYGDSGSNRILYAFLFYQKSALGSYRMFSQDSYQMDWCGAIYEVASTRTYTYTRPGGGQGCSDDIYQVYNEILRSSGKGGILDGYVFAWALFNFSTGLDSKQGKALEPPKPASEIAKQSKSRVIGEAPELVGTAGTDYILASCEKCNSMIPGELQLDKEFTLSVRRGDMDWQIVDGQAKSVLKI
ncbi:MAG: GWxTD domain-containing protein, partial [Patescibacteria group bacterium]